MREAAADLNFEEAARLRDEVETPARHRTRRGRRSHRQAARACKDKAGAYAWHEQTAKLVNPPRKSKARNVKKIAARRNFTLPLTRAGSAHRRCAGRADPQRQPLLLQNPQAPSRRNARPGIPALPRRRPHCRKNRSAATAGSSSRRISRQSGPAFLTEPRGRAAARRGIAVGGRSDR